MFFVLQLRDKADLWQSSRWPDAGRRGKTTAGRILETKQRADEGLRRGPRRSPRLIDDLHRQISSGPDEPRRRYLPSSRIIVFGAIPNYVLKCASANTPWPRVPFEFIYAQFAPGSVDFQRAAGCRWWTGRVGIPLSTRRPVMAKFATSFEHSPRKWPVEGRTCVFV